MTRYILLANDEEMHHKHFRLLGNGGLCLAFFQSDHFAAHALIDAVVAIGVEGKETEENGEEFKTQVAGDASDGWCCCYSWLRPVASCHDFRYKVSI